MEIITLLKSNLRHKKGSFISILVLMLIIATVLTSVVSIKYNMKNRVDDAHDSIDTGDLILYEDVDTVTDSIISKIESCNSVSRVRVCNTLLMRNTRINGKKNGLDIYIQSFDNNIYPYELFDKDFNDFVANKGKLQDKEILLPITMKESYSCKIGDTLSFDIGTEKFDLVIAGFIEEPSTGSNVMGVKNLIVSQQLYQTIKERSHIEENPENKYVWNGDLVHIYASAGYKNQINDVRKEVNQATNLISLAYYTLGKEQSITFTTLVTDIICGVMQSFVILLLVVVILVLSNNINSSIEMDFTNIGILKSQGFTKLQIRLVLLIQYLLSGLLGALLGIVLAIPLVHALRNLFINTSGLLFSGNVSLLRSAGLLFAILLVLAIFILIKTRKVSKISPVSAISGGLDTIYFKNVLETPVVGKSKSFLNLKLAFRQLTTSTGWYVGTCLIIGLLLSFLCMTASFKENFTEKYYNEMFGVILPDVKVNYDDTLEKQTEIEETIASITPIEKKVHHGEQYVLVDQEQNIAQILDDTSYFRTILEGRAPKYDNEIVVTRLVSNMLSKKIGESVEIQFQTSKKEYIISGIYESCSEAGRSIGMSLDGIRRIHSDYEIKSYGYFLKDSNKIQAVIDAVNQAHSESDNITAKKATSMSQNTIDTIMTTSNMVMLSICFISVIFAIIVICMICNKMFLKERQFLGIYKAFGFTTRSLRFQYCFRFLLVAIFGCLLGGTVFVFFGNTINSGILELAGITTYSAPVTWFNLSLPVLVICLTVILSSYITMGKVKKVDVKTLIVE